MIEPPGTRTQNLLIKSQPSFKKRRNPLDKIFSKNLYLGDTFVGGEYNVNTKIISAHPINKGGGTFNEDAGGNN